MIISRTPFRISFFGGGTDFPEFFNEHGGAVLATTVNKFCYITIHRLAPFFKYRYKANYARTETVQDISEIQHPLIRECLALIDVHQGLEIAHVSDLPGRTGLGTSSSFTVGLLHTLHAFRGDVVTPSQLAEEAILIERVRVADAGGHQDQYAAAFGGLMRVDFSRKGAAVRRLDLPADRMAELQSHLLLFYTGMEQSAEHILHEQRSKVKKNTSSLLEMLAMVDQAQDLLCGNESLNALGDLLHQSWLRKKSLSSGITNGFVDEAYEAALAAGAHGGKLLGAGGRGFLLLLAPPATHRSIRDRLHKLAEVSFGFAPEGSRIIFTSTD